MQQTRDQSIDVAKGIGMLMVVFGHTQSQYIQLVYQFHLPLFFFLSGVVFNEKKVDNIKKFVLNKIKNLWLPFVKYEMVFLLLHNVFSAMGFYTERSNCALNYTPMDTIKRAFLILSMGFGEKLAGPLWFLISSFEIVITFGLITFILRKLKVQENIQLMLIAIVGICSYLIGSATDLPRMGSQSLIGLLFFSVGYLYKGLKEKVSYKLFPAIICTAIIGICYEVNYVDISHLEINHKILLMISGLAGCYWTLYISKTLPQTIARVFEYCGKNTISVLALHCVSFKLVLIAEILICGLDWSYLGCFPTYDVNAVWTVAFTISGFTLPLVLCKIRDYLQPKLRGTL